MLNKSGIRDLAGSTIYGRGKRIYNENGVERFKIEESEHCDYIEAVVLGSGRNKYHVELAYDKENDCLDEVTCECPAFHSYFGICKHCTAVLLEYEDYQIRQRAIRRIALEQENSKNKLKSMKAAYSRKGSTRTGTTPAIKQLLTRRQNGRVLPVTQEDTYGKVRLIPHLIYVTAGMMLEFQIGIKQMYMIRDLLTFVRMMENKEYYSYGKKLAFVHCNEMFEPESQPIVKYILDWAKQSADRHQYSGYNYSVPKVRDIQLNGALFETFIDTVGSGKIGAGVVGQDEQVWEVVRKPLRREVQITGKDEGIEVTLDHRQVIQGNKDEFIFELGMIYRIPRTENEPIADFLSVVAKIPDRKIYIEKEDIPVFRRELLPELTKLCDCRIRNFNADDYGMVTPSFEIYLDSPQESYITCLALAVYGGQKFSLYDRQSDLERRDLVGEAEVKRIIFTYWNAYDEENERMVLADDDDLLYELLTVGIARMQEVAEVFISDALKKIKVSTVGKVAVGVSLAGNLMELRMTAGDMSREQLFEILSKYDRKKKYYRLKSGSFVDMQDEGIRALSEIRQGLGLTDKQMKQEIVTLPKYRALYLDTELKEYRALPVVKDKSFKTLVRNMKTTCDNDFEIPNSMNTILREYQKRGFLWLKTLKTNGFGGILADDMGLGKTLQVIALLESERCENVPGVLRRTLIVSPASLVFNWNSEILKFAPKLPVKMVIGKADERRELIRNAGEHDILLTSYDLLRRDSAVYQETAFANQIIDEAQYIKNQKTQAARAVKEIEAGFKLALTGTPVENRLSELWSIFDYLMPGFLYSYRRFREEIETPIVQNQKEEAMKRLQKMIRPFVLRRLKKDVLTDLPDKLEKNYFARLEGEQQKLYDAHVKRLQILLNKQSDEEFKQSKIQILSELTRLRQICCNPGLIFADYAAESVKTELCMELIKNAVSSGHKILLFSQFTSMLEGLGKRMNAEQISFYSLTGATSKARRARMVEAFNEDDTQVFCISLKAGGTGLNLTAADMVIHYDPWWNQAVQNQATDRAHRIGQKNVVTVFKLIAKDTIEENIMKLQEKKSELADRILGGEGLSGGSFTKQELLEILGGK